MKINDLPYFTDSAVKVKEILRRIGSAVHANLAWNGWRGDGLFTHSGQDWRRVACAFENVETRVRGWLAIPSVYMAAELGSVGASLGVLADSGVGIRNQRAGTRTAPTT
jgi:hypothetical protein